jgi:hypothetical protein
MAGNGHSPHRFGQMCNLNSITTNRAAIIALFRVINRYVGNLPPMPGVFPDYPAPAHAEYPKSSRSVSRSPTAGKAANTNQQKRMSCRRVRPR